MYDNFQVAKFQVVLIAGPMGLHLPPYKGSTLRGGFGLVFKKICCTQVNQSCADCLYRLLCAYANVFEAAPPPNSEVLKHISEIPRPFVIEPPLDGKTFYSPGEPLVFNLVLIGQAISILPYFILAFKELGYVGIGKGRLPYMLKEVRELDAHNRPGAAVYIDASERVQLPQNILSLADLSEPPAAGGTLTVRFLTMTRLKYGQNLVTEIPFHVLARNLLRRVSTLHYFYHGLKQETGVNYQKLIKRAEQVKTVASNLQLVDWERYSHRQQTRMNMAGLVGEATYSGEIAPFWPLFKLGELVHVGKGCVFGLGQYRIVE